MPAGVALSEMLSNLRAEIGDSMNVAHGVNQREMLVYTLQRVQTELWTMHDWPALQIDRDTALAAGVRFYSYHPDLDFETINAVWVRNSTVFAPVGYGVGPDEFNQHDSTSGDRGWPVRKWQHHADTNQMEVWPVPDQAGTLRVRGRQKLRPLVADSDTCTLDSTVIVLFAAAEILGRRKADDAQLKLSKAQALLVRLKARQGANKQAPFVIGGGEPVRPPRPGIDYIP